ncbi:MAG: hypothetical protein EBT82_00395 [Micrococcales bacterium]|nr:hypothetical protein [Micrococcales bacterium]NBR54439.1 hypothetical protein [Micrococcales bacterium]NBY44339.1 hypothetical protein [Micrococcales bacterium]NDE88901.1 hypothetical protein [Micrococcales bacterium]
MLWWLIGLWTLLILGSILALVLVLRNLGLSAKRLSRSIDPINQKALGLKLEVSALKRSRLDRQRRLESSKSAKTRK